MEQEKVVQFEPDKLGKILIELNLDTDTYNIAFTNVETAKMLKQIEAANLFSPFHAACIINEIKRRKENRIIKTRNRDCITMTEMDRLKLAADLYRNGLGHLMKAYEDMTFAINRLEKEECMGLDMFVHYRNQIGETHRIMAAEWERRWGSLKL